MTPANDNLGIPNIRTAEARRQVKAAADALLRANPKTERPAVRVRYRGGRPALNWLAKHDKDGAAALWLIARRRLPDAANDNREPGLGGIDRRKDGRPRGTDAPKLDTEAYLSMPPVRPRLGDAIPQPATPRGFHGWYDIKPQRPDMPFHPDCRFGYCAPAIAQGAFFLGAAGGLGGNRTVNRGDARRVEEPELPEIPDRVFVTIETMLARADLAGIGKALGYRGGYADRAGRRAMKDAAEWAKTATAA
ncbi:hypothetical protein JF546_19670 [Nitratireductor aquimarinus]|uniref:hypothetical protein n=1 Tax=Nitratireductor aquimarinus TaxID=889300 RepID=UPI001A8EB56C|nr:hypothetical protein [Nitratireductor aquimarinus]MBN8245240.1 hypothetical protein [Nitratireductor aquimarinus]MBY6133625.1 hypothetical protein [Nitratireductor aquimarinus]MCA1304724.1 hypothetical protein [Nitratireductor aquimarinus]